MCCFELLGNFRENVSDLFQANAGHAFKVNPTFSISSVEAGRMSQLPTPDLAAWRPPRRLPFFRVWMVTL